MAAVIAETRSAALDAAEAVDIDYAPRSAVIDMRYAIEGAEPIWPEAPDNVSMHWRTGDSDSVAAAFDLAAHVVTLEIVNNRVSANPMEMRGAVAEYDPARDEFTLYTNSQGQHETRSVMADDILGIPRGKLRVVCEDVGGGFGMKGFPYVEQALVLVAARRFGRPVAWFCDRTEALASDYHARDHVTEASLALNDEGRFLALKVDTLANVGAALSAYGLFIPTGCYVAGLPGAYDIPAIQVDVRGVFTNSSPRRCLSRCRAGRRDLRAGAADRPGGAQVRRRCAGTSSPKPARRRAVAIRNRAGRPIRLRRLPGMRRGCRRARRLD